MQSPCPSHAMVSPSSRPPYSRIVSASLTDWMGWSQSPASPLMTGTVAASASSRSTATVCVRAMIAWRKRESTRPVSATLSRPGRCISPGRR